MKKISKLICLVLVISMIFATFSVVFAEAETPALTINIIDLEEPVPDAVPSFNYDATFAKDLGISVNRFDIYEWLEVDETCENVLAFLDTNGETGSFWESITKTAYNEDNTVGLAGSIIGEELNYFEADKTYVAIFDCSFDRTIPGDGRGTVPKLFPTVLSTVNGKTTNVRTFVSLAPKSSGTKDSTETEKYTARIFAVYKATEPEPEPEPVEIPKIDIKATVDWVNTAEKNIPNSIVLKLMNGVSVVQEHTITKANAVDSDTWEYTFKDVPEEDEEGNKIAYTLAYAEANKNDLKFFNTAVKDFTIENTFIDPEIKSNVKMTSIVDREENNVKYKITFNSSIKKYSGDAEVVLTTTLPFTIDETKSKLDGGTYDAKTRSIVWTETITNIEDERDYKMIKNIDIYPTAVLPYAIEAKTVGEVKLTAVADYSESVDTVDTIESTNGNPKTGDINLTRYSTIGLIGVAAIGMAITIKRKYSTRKSKVQY